MLAVVLPEHAATVSYDSDGNMTGATLLLFNRHPSEPRGTEPAMTARRRLCLMLAAASVAAVLHPAPSAPVFAAHEPAPAGSFWTAGTGGSYTRYTHYNQWRCANQIAFGSTTANAPCTKHTFREGGGSLPASARSPPNPRNRRAASTPSPTPPAPTGSTV